MVKVQGCGTVCDFGFHLRNVLFGLVTVSVSFASQIANHKLQNKRTEKNKWDLTIMMFHNGKGWKVLILLNLCDICWSSGCCQFHWRKKVTFTVWVQLVYSFFTFYLPQELYWDLSANSISNVPWRSQQVDVWTKSANAVTVLWLIAEMLVFHVSVNFCSIDRFLILERKNCNCKSSFHDAPASFYVLPCTAISYTFSFNVNCSRRK